MFLYKKLIKFKSYTIDRLHYYYVEHKSSALKIATKAIGNECISCDNMSINSITYYYLLW